MWDEGVDMHTSKEHLLKRVAHTSEDALIDMSR